jgi:hypothetical protein
LPQPGHIQAYLLGGTRRCMADPHRHRRVLYAVGSISTVDEVIVTC